MRKQALIPLVIGLLVGLGALKLGYDLVSKAQNEKGGPAGPTKQIAIASHALVMGTTLTDKDVVLVAMPEQLVPDGTTGELKELIGQTIRENVGAKMPIVKAMVNKGQGFQSVIPEGYRAITVKTDEFAGVAGLLNPGDNVDVAATFTLRRDGKSEVISKLILQNVKVRAVGQNYTEDAGEGQTAGLTRSVTLLVKPDQVERLQLAASYGKIRLALRAAMDDTRRSTSGLTLEDMLSEGMSMQADTVVEKFVKIFSAPPTTQPSSTAYEVEVIVAGKTEIIYFENSDSDRRITPAKRTNDIRIDFKPASMVIESDEEEAVE